MEVKHVDLPEDMQRAMARQAEAEREKRAKIIHADGEFASDKLAQAAAIIDASRRRSAALSADADRDRRGEELDDHLSAADRDDADDEGGFREVVALP